MALSGRVIIIDPLPKTKDFSSALQIETSYFPPYKSKAATAHFIKQHECGYPAERATTTNMNEKLKGKKS